MAYQHVNSKGQAYYLHAKEVTLRNGRRQKIHFFGRHEKSGQGLDRVPGGYRVSENERTGLPFLTRADGAAAEAARRASYQALDGVGRPSRDIADMGSAGTFKAFEALSDCYVIAFQAGLSLQAGTIAAGKLMLDGSAAFQRANRNLAEDLVQSVYKTQAALLDTNLRAARFLVRPLQVDGQKH
jgi:hypothetical protein